MIKIDTYRDLMTRPILEALIEKRKTKSDETEQRPVVNTRTKLENRGKGEESSYVFDLPEKSTFRNTAGRGLLELAADEQDVQYMIAQITLSNLGLIPKVYRSRRINVNPSNVSKINKIKTLLTQLFSHTVLDDDAPAEVLKTLLANPKMEIDNKVGFNTFDLLNRVKSWDQVLDNLKKNVARSIAGLSGRAEKTHKISQDFHDRIGKADWSDTVDAPKTVADVAKNIFGESVDEIPETLTQEEKEKMFVNAYSILKPLYEAASKSGLSPAGYLKFQQNLDRVAGALKTNEISKYINEIEAKRQPRTVEDYKDVLIEALARAVKGDDSKMQVSNLISKQATTALRWLTRHLTKLGYTGGLKIANVLDYIKNGDDEYANDARYYLENIYNITPDQLTVQNFPSFKKFVNTLYQNFEKVMGSYKALKDRPKASQRLNLKNPDKPMVTDRKGGIGQSIPAIKKSIEASEKLLANFDEKNERLQKAIEFDKEWKAGKAKMYVAVTAGTLGLGGRTDTSPVIEFGEVTRPELNKMTADNLANGYIDLVTPKYKEAYKNLLESDPELPKKIRNHIIKQKNVAPGKVANQLRFDLGKTLNKDGSSNRQWYIDRINKFKEQLAAVSGEKVEKETVERKKLSDFSDEGVEGDIDMPYTIFKVDETAPRLISPIIVALKKTLEKYNATVDWSTNFEDEEGYITIYYPENGKFFNAKDPKKLVEDLRKSIQTMAARLGYDYVDITTYSYEFAKDQYDSSGFVIPQDDEDSEEDIEINNDSESAEIESEFESEDEEETDDPLVLMALDAIEHKKDDCESASKKPVKREVKFIPNKDRYPRERIQNQWRKSYFWNQ